MRKGVIFTAMGAASRIPRNDYSEQWRRYKRFKKLCLFYLLGWIPVIGAYIMLIRTFGEFTPRFLGIYLLLGPVAGIGQAIWPCPRCGKFFSNPSRFFVRDGVHEHGMARACVHCGLPRFAPDDSGLMPLCPKCRCAVPVRFCPKCGTALNVGSAPPPPISVTPPPQL
jgi:hypothetical protein